MLLMLLDAVTGAATRTTAEFNVDGYSRLALHVSLTARTSTTKVSVKVLGSDVNGGSTFRYVQANEVGSLPVVTVADITYDKTVSAADSWIIQDIDVSALHDCKIEVSFTSGAAGDVLDLYGEMYNPWA